MPSKNRQRAWHHTRRGLLTRPSVLKQKKKKKSPPTANVDKSEATCNLISHDLISSLDTYIHTYVPQYSTSRALAMTAQARHSGYLVPLPLSPSSSSLLAMAHLSICDTRHGFVAGWLDGLARSGVWGARLTMEKSMSGTVGQTHCTTRLSNEHAMRCAWTACLPIVPACPALPCLSFLDLRRGARKRCHAYQGHFSARRLRPSSVLRPPPNTSPQASRMTAPARRSRQATGSRLKLYRGFGQDGLPAQLAVGSIISCALQPR